MTSQPHTYHHHKAGQAYFHNYSDARQLLSVFGKVDLHVASSVADPRNFGTDPDADPFL
jgi:hypothetical protein